MIPLLLTSTIKPHNSDGIVSVRQTETERFLEYRRALLFYQRQLKDTPIIFADNSHSTLFQQMDKYSDLSGAGRWTETLNLPVVDESKIMGKGFGEGLLINEVLGGSQIVQKCDAFIKVTGRYRIYNIKRFVTLLEKSRQSQDVQFDFVALCSRDYASGVSVFPTYMFYSKRQFWTEYLASSYKEVNDKTGFALEKVLTDRVIGAARLGRKVGIFPVPALISSTNPSTREKSITKRALFNGQARTQLARLLNRKSEIDTLNINET